MNQVSFDVSNADRVLIQKNVARAVATGLIQKRDALDRAMDLTACHANGCPLDLDGLLNADGFNFAHDVLGIARHMDRETGKLNNCFLPRYRA